MAFNVRDNKNDTHKRVPAGIPRSEDAFYYLRPARHTGAHLRLRRDDGHKSEEKIMAAITKNEPAYYLVKSDWDLSQVIEKIKERLSRKV